MAHRLGNKPSRCSKGRGKTRFIALLPRRMQSRGSSRFLCRNSRNGWSRRGRGAGSGECSWKSSPAVKSSTHRRPSACFGMGCFPRWPGRVQKLRQNHHIIMQMNADTICCKHSFLDQLWIDAVIRKRYVDIAATDSHNVTSRPCRMRACYRALKQRFGLETANRLCVTNPSKIK